MKYGDAGIFRLFYSLKETIGYRYKPLHSISTGSPMVLTLDQRYNTGEKRTVMLCTYIDLHEGTPKQKQHKNICI